MPKRLPKAVADPTGVPDQAGDVRGLALILVTTDAQMRIWNEMMIREHPRGHGPLVGRQVRYLIDSEHGWLARMRFQLLRQWALPRQPCSWPAAIKCAYNSCATGSAGRWNSGVPLCTLRFKLLRQQW